jgi:hypothetical protein
MRSYQKLFVCLALCLLCTCYFDSPIAPSSQPNAVIYLKKVPPQTQTFLVQISSADFSEFSFTTGVGDTEITLYITPGTKRLVTVTGLDSEGAQSFTWSAEKSVTPGKITTFGVFVP